MIIFVALVIVFVCGAGAGLGLYGLILAVNMPKTAAEYQHKDSCTEPKNAEYDESEAKERKQIANFWAYDGTEQEDITE